MAPTPGVPGLAHHGAGAAGRGAGGKASDRELRHLPTRPSNFRGLAPSLRLRRKCASADPARFRPLWGAVGGVSSGPPGRCGLSYPRRDPRAGLPGPRGSERAALSRSRRAVGRGVKERRQRPRGWSPAAAALLTAGFPPDVRPFQEKGDRSRMSPRFMIIY